MLNNVDANTPELVVNFSKYLNCSCDYFPPMKQDKTIIEAYNKARQRGIQEGFVPVLIVVEDILWESLRFNVDSEAKNGSFDMERVAAYRKENLSATIKDTTEFFEKCNQEDYWPEWLIGEMESEGESESEGEEELSFRGYRSYSSDITKPTILAEIPVKNPWEVFAYVPFGGWNECPGTEDLMSVAKYWFEKYGAVPAVIAYDTLEFELPQSVDSEQAMHLAKEQYLFCRDIVDQGVETIGRLADILRQYCKWFFWWD